MFHPDVGWVDLICLACRLHDHADCDGDTTWCEDLCPDLLEETP